MSAKRIDIWHNILWSRYKGGVFSTLHALNTKQEFDIHFYQMAETEGNRQSLSKVDETYHNYPYTLVFQGALDSVPFHKRLKEIVIRTFKSNADLMILTGYEKPEVWAQIAILKLKRKKVMIFCDATAFDQPQNALKRLIKKIIFQTVDGVFGYGERARDYALSYGTKSKNWHKRCQAAALPHDYDEALIVQKRLELATSSDAPRYLYVGRLSVEKNLGRLLEAFAKLKNNLPQAELVIIGGGDQKQALEEKAITLGLDPATIFIGSKGGQDLYDEYAKATCFVLPSLSEPWGLVVNEALHYGCPVIVSNRCGCVPELVIEGESGFSHDPYSVDDIYDKMMRASIEFQDTQKTAKACLTIMKNQTPQTAALQMIEGIRKTL